MKCGREPGSGCTDVLSVCLAATDKTFDGINRGKNAGRICWAVAGTSFGGSIQGSFAEKLESCTTCPFYKEVQAQEGQQNLQTKFLRFIHQASFFPKLRNMAYRHIKTGERFVVQGAVEENAYIIQKGSCLVIVEIDGQLHPVDHFGKGDIVGGLGILTGEPRRAHVEAETDMEVRQKFKEPLAPSPKPPYLQSAMVICFLVLPSLCRKKRFVAMAVWRAEGVRARKMASITSCARRRFGSRG